MPDARTFFTSDEHHGHRNIIGYCNRPFSDVHEMTEEMVRRHNAVVGPNDVVFHLGDFAMDERLVERVLRRLNGHHRLIPGNHDRCHPCHRSWQAARNRYLRYGFETVDMRLSGEHFDAEHLPYTGDKSDRDRYAKFRPEDKGGWLLHGHIHEKWKVRGRMINVGVDVWDFTPVALEDLLAIKRTG